MCSISGAKRRIEFLDKQQDSYRNAVLSLDPTDGSLYNMKAGCQRKFLHRVRKNKKVREGRFCLSLRCFVGNSIDAPAIICPSTLQPTFQSTPVPQPSTPTNMPDKITPDMSAFEDISKTPNGYAPFSADSTSTS